MGMKKSMLVMAMAVLIYACANNNASKKEEATAQTPGTENGNPSYDPNRGVGKFTKVEISPSLDKAMAETGQKVYDVKCASCHKLTDEKLVGPGWKGVTSRHQPEWILNFVT